MLMLIRLRCSTRLVTDTDPYPSRLGSEMRIKLVLLMLLFTVSGFVNGYMGLMWLLSVLSILAILLA